MEAAEAIVEQLDGIGKLRGSLFLHDHADQLHAVPLGAGNQSLARFGGISGLASHQVRVGVGLSGKKLVLGRDKKLLADRGGTGNGVGRRSGHLAEQIVGEKGPGDLRHIIGGGVVVLIENPIGVGKMGIHTAELLRSFVHQLREFLHASADMLRQGGGHLVRRSHEKPVERLLHGDLLSRFDADVGVGLPVDAVHRFVGIGYRFLQGTLLHDDQRGQDLGDAGGIQLFMDIFFIQDGSGLRFHKNGGFGSQRRACGPVLPFVGRYGKLLSRFRLGGIIPRRVCGRRGLRGNRRKGKEQDGCAEDRKRPPPFPHCRLRTGLFFFSKKMNSQCFLPFQTVWGSPYLSYTIRGRFLRGFRKNSENLSKCAAQTPAFYPFHRKRNRVKWEEKRRRACACRSRQER